VAPKRNVFRGKNFADPTIKKTKIWLPNLKYQLKNKDPPLAKNVTKRYHSVVTHVLYHFSDMSLITACEIFCSLKFHVVCTCTFFGNTICFVKMIKIVTLIDSHIVLTNDCWRHCFSVNNILTVSHVFEMTIHFYLIPNPWVVLFFIYPTFYLLKILFTQPFSLRCHPPP
jgi:hypothetical protein